jgi:hypothetical protein
MSEQSTAATPSKDAAADATTETSTPATTDASTKPADTTTATVLGDAPTDADKGAVTDPDKAKVEDKPTDQPEPKAPEKYELTAPEGFQLEPETAAEFETLARELDLSNEDANKLIPLGAKLAQKIGEQQQAAHVAQVARWLDESKADTEFGGDKFDASVVLAKQAMDKFGTPELKTLMDLTGLGNNPEVVRLFHRIGAAIADDTFVVAPSGGGTAKSLPDRMYPTS